LKISSVSQVRVTQEEREVAPLSLVDTLVITGRVGIKQLSMGEGDSDFSVDLDGHQLTKLYAIKKATVYFILDTLWPCAFVL